MLQTLRSRSYLLSIKQSFYRNNQRDIGQITNGWCCGSWYSCSFVSIGESFGSCLRFSLIDPIIRGTVLASLDDRFDKHLAQAEYVRSLFIALNDEVFSNRVLAIGLIGRLALHNPAYVIPSLRKALIQLLTELEYSTITFVYICFIFVYNNNDMVCRRSREEASRLLTLLTSATQRLIKPYALPMLRVLLPKATDSNPIVAGQVLLCIGELSSVGGEDFAPHIPQVMSVILATLSDPAAIAKREASLITLGQLCTNTSYVISPIMEHPQLLPMLGRILKSETSANVRRQVIRLLGILGAIDPYRRKVSLPLFSFSISVMVEMVD